MHPVKRLSSLSLAIAAMLLPCPASALLTATQNSTGWNGSANLVASRMTIQVASEWIDVEEESELSVTPFWNSDEGAWIVQGTFSVPRGTAITGCMLWNDDTLLMGKLRGKVQANKIFDSLVPPVTTRWPVDPLLVEQISDTVYNLKLYPVATGGSRRFRLRYLVPRPGGTEKILVKPLMASSVNGTRPSAFRLRLRGKIDDLRLATSAGIWPIDLPYSEMVSFDSDAWLLWKGATKGAVRGSVASGKWAGDYVMYSGSVPDSILRKTTIRSETVVLWNWVSPSSFLYESYGNRYLTSLGYEALQQAGLIAGIADQVGTNGGRMGLVADMGTEVAPREYPLADTAAMTFKNMRKWLSAMDADYLMGTVASVSTSPGSNIVSSLGVAKLRQRFTVDIRKAASMYSADSGVIRHLVVVTAGLSASGETPEDVDPDLLPEGVSVSSSRLVSNGSSYVYVSGTGYVYTPNKPSTSSWPGINLSGLVASRPGTGTLADWKGVPLPKVRTLSAARLSIKSNSGLVRRNVVLRRDAAGVLRGVLNAHASSLDKAVQWEIFDDSGRTLTSWSETPSWTDATGDSVLQRLWAKSEFPVSAAFEDKDLGPIFGVVDPYHSLLATPSDTVGAVRQAVLRDSGVPFLSYAEIFPRQGYGGEGGSNDGSAVERRMARSNALHVVWVASTRSLRIDLDGLDAQAIEIRDLQGRSLASFSRAQIAGLKSFEWRVPAQMARGMLLVSMRTASGVSSSRVMVQ